jgi:hypothetical protein
MNGKKVKQLSADNGESLTDLDRRSNHNDNFLTQGLVQSKTLILFNPMRAEDASEEKFNVNRG